MGQHNRAAKIEAILVLVVRQVDQRRVRAAIQVRVAEELELHRRNPGGGYCCGGRTGAAAVFQIRKLTLEVSYLALQTDHVGILIRGRLPECGKSYLAARNLSLGLSDRPDFSLGLAGWRD